MSPKAAGIHGADMNLMLVREFDMTFKQFNNGSYEICDKNWRIHGANKYSERIPCWT